MESTSWKVLFRRIPQTHHDNLTLSAANGMEISLQSILRLEDDYMLVRGRLGGTTETGKVLIVPYDQITYMAFTRTISEPEVRAMYGEKGSGEAQTVMVDAKGDTEVLGPEGLQTESSMPTEAPLASNKTPVPPPARPNLVDRLRSRPTPPPQKPPSK